MSCNGCTKRFGLLTKECLRFTIKQGSKRKNVCLRCYELNKTAKPSNEGPNEQERNLSVIDKTVEDAAYDGVLKPTQNYSAVEPVSETDIQIKQRLAALKQEQNARDISIEPSNQDIEKRLAALKGLEYKDYTEANKRLLNQRDTRTQEEQVEGLMKQFSEEQEIHDVVSDYQLTAIEEIEKRLALLKDGSENNTGEQKPTAELQEYDYSEENEEDTADKLTKRFLEEVALDARKSPKYNEDELNNLDIPTPVEPSDVEELPWCTICNEDARIRCLSCGGELFCNGCFKECHDDDEEYRVHKTKHYKPPC
ncbi:abscission/NoCut checkpoint regulator isoform X2 [Wyeomyia smithii]|uniref:abscission/NoCut checkpoint regulator isoform X2 n=1 Tax=Wyeomyia smithii TaxID=174621 RepID=UPI002467D681|nr:abscission/NoCut checkpoint regulator isoform X2 [Wyeomyia smithii]